MRPSFSHFSFIALNHSSHYGFYNLFSTKSNRPSVRKVIRRYNEKRLHQSLGIYDRPSQPYYELVVSMACYLKEIHLKRRLYLVPTAKPSQTPGP
ncbi:MAG TPA: hypothetical protein DCW97_04730 [Acidobacteria bacterium]|nr:hypothetical protein [Acidobacteriota bacterium]